MTKLKISELRAIFVQVFSDAEDWFTEGKEISRFIFPKRGKFDSLSPIKKKQNQRADVINPAAVDAFAVLTSGLHGRLTGQYRHWCQLDFLASRAKQNKILTNWLYSCQKKLHSAWRVSNFYEAMPSLYTECSGFGTSALHIADSSEYFFSFSPMTFGEFVFTVDSNGRLDMFFRIMDLTLRQLEMVYGRDALPESMQENLKANKAFINTTTYRVVNAIYKENYFDKPIKSVHFFEGSTSNVKNSGEINSFVSEYPERPLKVAGYYDYPVIAPRWETVGTYPMGMSLGSDVLQLVKRLQEMEKSFMKATHKAVDPPYNVPSRLRDTVSLLPGAYNFTSNPDHKIEPIINSGFEYTGVSAAAERVERAIQKLCYNDVFLTAMRDPNASPLKARQIDNHEDEGIMRLGPIVGRFNREGLAPLVIRCFNSMYRRNLFDPIDPALLQQAGGLSVTLIGPLAQMQKLIEVRSIQTFFNFLGGIVPFDDKARDKISIDRTVDEVADMTGVPTVILSTDDELKINRDNRAAAEKERRDQEKAILASKLKSESMAANASAAKDYAAAGTDISTIMGASQ